MRNKIKWRLGLMAVIFPAVCLASQAETYPSKPVQLVAPMAPGGGIDTLARYVSQKLSERLGKTVVVENRPGANGNIGAGLVSRAPADGYTLLATYVGTQAINPSLYKNLGFDPIEDFEAVAPLAAASYAAVINASVPANTFQELVEYARANPGTLNYGSAGMGSVGHLAGKLFEQETGTELTYISYKGTAPALIDLRAGRIQVMFNTLSSMKSNLDDGTVRALALLSPTPSGKHPDVPTTPKIGYKNLEVSTWFGIVAPKGTPKDIVEQLNREINLVLEDEEVKKWFADHEYETMHMSASEFSTFITQERDRWNKIIVDGKVTIE